MYNSYLRHVSGLCLIGIYGDIYNNTISLVEDRGKWWLAWLAKKILGVPDIFSDKATLLGNIIFKIV